MNRRIKNLFDNANQYRKKMAKLKIKKETSPIISSRDILNDIRAQQQMIEGGIDTSEEFERIEKTLVQQATRV